MKKYSISPDNGIAVEIENEQKWHACATRSNVAGKADYLWTLRYTNGAPVRYSTEAEALKAAALACDDAAHKLYDPRAVKQQH